MPSRRSDFDLGKSDPPERQDDHNANDETEQHLDATRKQVLPLQFLFERVRGFAETPSD